LLDSLLQELNGAKYTSDFFKFNILIN